MKKSVIFTHFLKKCEKQSKKGTVSLCYKNNEKTHFYANPIRKTLGRMLAFWKNYNRHLLGFFAKKWVSLFYKKM
jgi:hypothetical protein